MPDGAISYAGTTTQNQTLAATLIDADGVPSDTAVSYRWQQSADGSTWTDIPVRLLARLRCNRRR